MRLLKLLIYTGERHGPGFPGNPWDMTARTVSGSSRMIPNLAPRRQKLQGRAAGNAATQRRMVKASRALAALTKVAGEWLANNCHGSCMVYVWLMYG